LPCRTTPAPHHMLASELMTPVTGAAVPVRLSLIAPSALVPGLPVHWLPSSVLKTWVTPVAPLPAQPNTTPSFVATVPVMTVSPPEAAPEADTAAPIP
jgi:hypothetical protein